MKELWKFVDIHLTCQRQVFAVKLVDSSNQPIDPIRAMQRFGMNLQLQYDCFLKPIANASGMVDVRLVLGKNCEQTTNQSWSTVNPDANQTRQQNTARCTANRQKRFVCVYGCTLVRSPVQRFIRILSRLSTSTQILEKSLSPTMVFDLLFYGPRPQLGIARFDDC